MDVEQSQRGPVSSVRVRGLCFKEPGREAQVLSNMQVLIGSLALLLGQDLDRQTSGQRAQEISTAEW